MLKFHFLVKKNTFLHKRLIQSFYPKIERKILKIKCQLNDVNKIPSRVSQESIQNTKNFFTGYIHYFMYIYLFFHCMDKLLDIQYDYEVNKSLDDDKITSNLVKKK